jgi:hypothetical protein
MKFVRRQLFIDCHSIYKMQIQRVHSLVSKIIIWNICHFGRWSNVGDKEANVETLDGKADAGFTVPETSPFKFLGV